MFSDEFLPEEASALTRQTVLANRTYGQVKIKDEQREQYVSNAVRCQPLDVLCERLDIIKEG